MFPTVLGVFNAIRFDLCSELRYDVSRQTKQAPDR